MTNHGFIIAICICLVITLATSIALSTMLGGDISIENNPNFVVNQTDLGSNAKIEYVLYDNFEYGLYKVTMDDGTICYVIRSYESSGISCLKP